MRKYNTLVLYTNATCNLRCKYCNIDKNEALVEVDKALEESFKGNYYFEQSKKLFKRWELTSIETWGGEPFLHMERLYPTLHKVIDYYPYFKTLFSSTNFSYPTWNDKFFDLLSQFKQYAPREFVYNLQLSCDGPTYINDRGRGEGTTQKCIEVFNTMVTRLNEVPDNVTLDICIKPTLDLQSIEELCTKEKIYEYYKFFEDTFLEPIFKANLKNVIIHAPVPNTAVPSPTTVQDGHNFATLVKCCKELEKENRFKYYKYIVPFNNMNIKGELSYINPCALCGSGFYVVGILPDNNFSICHEGFTQFSKRYKKISAESDRGETSSITFSNDFGNERHSLCVNEKQLEEFERKVDPYNRECATARIAMATTQIVTLAMAGQVDKRFLDFEEAKRAAWNMMNATFCIKDNMNITGSLTMQPFDLYKLILNGAYEYIYTEDLIDGQITIPEGE